MNDIINHPKHYTSHVTGIECYQIAMWMPGPFSHAIKYLWRAGLKEDNDRVRDLQKAVWWMYKCCDFISEISKESDFIGSNDYHHFPDIYSLFDLPIRTKRRLRNQMAALILAEEDGALHGFLSLIDGIFCVTDVIEMIELITEQEMDSE